MDSARLLQTNFLESQQRKSRYWWMDKICVCHQQHLQHLNPTKQSLWGKKTRDHHDSNKLNKSFLVAQITSSSYDQQYFLQSTRLYSILQLFYKYRTFLSEQATPQKQSLYWNAAEFQCHMNTLGCFKVWLSWSHNQCFKVRVC